MKIVFMGTPDFAVASLDAICATSHSIVGVVTVPDRQTGRGLKVTYSPVKEYALAHNLRILQPDKLRNADFLDELRSLGADLFVVVAFRMLPRDVWAMPPLGTFNLHASLLPQYRGAAPINWAIINGEKETGATTFLLNERIDEGQILLQRHTPISNSDTAETLHDRLAEMSRQMVVDTINGLESGTLKGQPQMVTDEQRPAPKIFKSDCLINWMLSGEQIVNFVRGLSPYPAALMQILDDKGTTQQIKIFEVNFTPSTAEETPIAVGSFLTDKKSYLKIRIFDGFITILSLQISGKRRNTIDAFLRGNNVDNWRLIH